MACFSGEYVVSEDGLSEPRQWRPLMYRKCTDSLWLMLFFLFWAGLMFITGYAVTAGAAERLVFGYDSYGNICGRKNTPVAGAPLSGQDMTNRKFVFFLNSCDLKIQNLKINSTALCVSSCPQEQLNSLEDIQLFADNNGSCLCVYSLNTTGCIHNPKAPVICPSLPVPPSVSFPLFNRCVPQNDECYSQFAPVLIDVVNEVDIFHRVLSGIMAGRETVIGLCVLALSFSIIVMLIFRFISILLIHIFLTLVVFGLLFVSGIMWWLYCNYTNEPSIELETEKENMKLLLGFSILSTIVTVVLLLLILILRKRIGRTIHLFQVVSKIISNIPSLLFQPLWTFMILIFFWVYWVAVLLSLGTAGNAVAGSRGQVEYKILFGIRYMWWYHLVGLIWTSEFVLACQQMTVSGAVVTCFFNRNKSKPPSHPVLSSISILFCYHLGTVVKGSFLITVVRIPRIILLSIYNILKEKENTYAKCMFKCCSCCFWCLERGLRCLNQNAYTATAINGTSFCTSAKDAVVILAKGSSNTMAINCFGDFIIFLGKIFVVCFTVFGGLMAFNYHRELRVWVIPLLLVALFAYLVAHSFLSIFETIIEALFLCFAIDIETNDGSQEKPYFMDHELMNFVYQRTKLTEENKQRNKKTLHSSEYDTELQPMTRT
ncbi:choline transporter-like protein 3 isoform X1 [Sphaerodactylus townsendi]|uniref:choline transporter-like protein 3 isoform X1 n=2 Tax=Sphaerodactylus townsendi TaxID=933632 RepID=UPI0020276186|nr:choline transporter-like protein 3 isoform X1 [Sphaerodactylus townsendi]